MSIYRVIAPRIGRHRLDEWRRRVRYIVMFLVGIIVSCAVGLALLDNAERPMAHKLLDGLWNAANLVTTLGAFTPFDLQQKGFMLFIMLGVIVTGAYAIGQLTGILSHPDVVAYRENLRMERSLNRLEGHVVVLGFIGLGQMLATRLREAGRQVVVIDRSDANAALASDMGFVVVQGDAGHDDGVLQKAKIDTACALFVTTEEPIRNLALTLAAHTLNPQLRIIVTGETERWGEMMRRAGASEVVIADRLLAESMLGHLDPVDAGEDRRPAPSAASAAPRGPGMG